ncbi:hypothetical protein OG592_39320 [Streptomyces avidinii]|uniref:hypothetical protein n=1 Tax=Streptomyces avidinii TaxID=1895 RepID=UPI003864A732|nr:hypothetical protein OG592_39320 [Streptomyces avidinii]
MPAHLTHDPQAIASPTADTTTCPTTTRYARQQLAEPLHDAVLAHPDFSPPPGRPPTAGRTWLQHDPLADTVMAPADDGTDPRHHLDDAQWITTYAISAVAHTIDVYGRDETAEHLTQIRNADFLPHLTQ